MLIVDSSLIISVFENSKFEILPRWISCHGMDLYHLSWNSQHLPAVVLESNAPLTNPLAENVDKHIDSGIACVYLPKCPQFHRYFRLQRISVQKFKKETWNLRQVHYRNAFPIETYNCPISIIKLYRENERKLKIVWEKMTIATTITSGEFC